MGELSSTSTRLVVFSLVFIKNACTGGAATATGNKLIVNAAAGGGLSTIKNVADIATGISALYFAGAHLRDRYVAGDDARLITKLINGECGGIHQASPNVARCFKKYLIEALYRFSTKSPYEATKEYYAHFNKCLGRFNDNDCEDGWFSRTDVFKK